MRSWAGIVIAAALAVAAAIGWRGSRPASPTATVHSDGVTVVPATGTLRRADAVAAAVAAPTPTAPTPTAPTPTATPAAPTVALDINGIDRLPALLAAQARDPAWAPGAEGRLRGAFAGIPHLGGPLKVSCAATLCEIAGGLAAGLTPAESDAALGSLQGSSMARTRADFADNMVRLEQPPDGLPATFTVWLVRR